MRNTGKYGKMRVIRLQVRGMWYARKGCKTLLDSGKGKGVRPWLSGAMPGAIAVIGRGTFMIQTMSRRIPMGPAVVAVVAPAVAAAATVVVAAAAAAAGFGLHRCEDIPPAQGSPIPD